MNADLEAELNENTELVSVVARLRAGKEVCAASEVRGQRSEGRQWRWHHPAWLVAASLLLVIALAIFHTPSPSQYLRRLAARALTSFSTPSTLTPQPSTVYGAREYRLSVDEMIATQKGDGGWGNDFQTRRNAAALEHETSSAARIAYKKALRNLRTKGAL